MINNYLKLNIDFESIHEHIFRSIMTHLFTSSKISLSLEFTMMQLVFWKLLGSLRIALFNMTNSRVFNIVALFNVVEMRCGFVKTISKVCVV